MATEWKQVHLLLTPQMLKQLDQWRRRQTDIPDRSESIRRILATEFKAAGILEQADDEQDGSAGEKDKGREGV